jgi:uncharacterized protein YjlB
MSKAATLALTPLSSLTLSTHHIPARELIPNTSIQHKPLLIYRSAFPPAATASQIESHLSSTGAVQPQWRYTMYSTTHFHSTTHEVLAVASGSAKVCFGGEHNPGRVETKLEKGDVVVVPAGVGHRLLEEEKGKGEGGFLMVGSYPAGCTWDMCYGRAGEEERVKGIGELGWFERDPVYGDKGPVLEI